MRATNMTMVAMRRVLANILWHCFTGPIRKHVLMPTKGTRERNNFLLIQHSYHFICIVAHALRHFRVSRKYNIVLQVCQRSTNLPCLLFSQLQHVSFHKLILVTLQNHNNYYYCSYYYRTTELLYYYYPPGYGHYISKGVEDGKEYGPTRQEKQYGAQYGEQDPNAEADGEPLDAGLPAQAAGVDNLFTEKQKI